MKGVLWGGEFWSDGYFVATVGRHDTEQLIRRYIKEQGAKGTTQLALF